MTRLVALEASSEYCSVALFDDGKMYYRQSLAAKSNANTILPLLDALVIESGVALQELDGLSITIGPGSFTGIRISMAVTQGLALAHNLKVIPVNSLELMAFQYGAGLSDSDLPIKVLPLLDARMNEYYWAVYQILRSGMIEITAPTLGSGDTLNALLSELSEDDRIVGVGTGWGLHSLDKNILFRCDEKMTPNAKYLALIAAKRLQQGYLYEIDEVEPLYLRNEINWDKRKRIRSRN